MQEQTQGAASWLLDELHDCDESRYSQKAFYRAAVPASQIDYLVAALVGSCPGSRRHNRQVGPVIATVYTSVLISAKKS